MSKEHLPQFASVAANEQTDTFRQANFSNEVLSFKSLGGNMKMK